MFDGGKRGHLARIVVDPSSRGKGFGRIFCEKLISEAKKLNCRTISLKVNKDNSTAISLYRKLGFKIPSEQPDNIGENTYYMELAYSHFR
jgi:ribosomal protein S18 acetylase RimI-like enzyme